MRARSSSHRTALLVSQSFRAAQGKSSLRLDWHTAPGRAKTHLSVVYHGTYVHMQIKQSARQSCHIRVPRLGSAIRLGQKRFQAVHCTVSRTRYEMIRARRHSRCWRYVLSQQSFKPAEVDLADNRWRYISRDFPIA